MTDTRDKIWLALIVLGSAVGLYAGWKLFWFLTDDSLIAFRYCSNSLAGLGYVWNPPPFTPVEGYTSFLWVVLMDLLWRLTGLNPTVTANTVSLIFSGLTLLLVGRVVLSMVLPRPLTRYRMLLLALVMLGCLSNRTFLAWTSSGLETAMFNFFVTGWIVAAFFYRPDRAGQTLAMATLAVLTYLTRPDGMLVLLLTGGLLGLALVRPLVREKLNWRHYLVIVPLSIPPLHLIWRVSFYGEWLPNTYYAKHVSAWPESGLRYLGSFVLEYGLVVWLAVLLVAVILYLYRLIISRASRKADEPVSRAAADRGDRMTTLAGHLAAVGFVVAHIGYYTLIIGGDHFEYRVFSYVVPFLFLSCLWLLIRISLDGIVVASALGLFIVCGWPLPWTHWALSHDLETRDETHVMFVPVAENFPPPSGPTRIYSMTTRVG